MSRRDVLAAGIVGTAGLLASCAAPKKPPAAPESSAPVPTSTVVGVAKPAPAEIAARYAHAEPQGWGLDLPGIVQSTPNPRSIALTFDACGGPQGSLIDDPLLATLTEHNVPATLFWNKRWIEANPQRAREIAGNPLFQIENHGTAHKPLSVNGRAAYGIPGTASAAEVVEEIEGNRQFMRDFLGVESNWFRSGTAHYDDVAVRIAGDLGVSIAGFAVNGDAGATLPRPVVEQNLLGSTPGAIVIMHMNQPGGGTAAGVSAAIEQLRAAGYTFTKLGAAPL
ncbi:polysaccharide deacetylase [Corynebacterium liangguodongii]|uniref:Polysaccharide deacetylase n=2 Tax=Corynebacterium liangguodongii TaxID=2079535 RepID=A0A2S0WGV6_9CORY|nr:polysaccharide deacetylase [Corynebacterium liangguodongii]PWC00679.1 polysaccharide deacetylase [Corynebacterium liangguodongii]